jgi:hypothetical protein
MDNDAVVPPAKQGPRAKLEIVGEALHTSFSSPSVFSSPPPPWIFIWKEGGFLVGSFDVSTAPTRAAALVGDGLQITARAVRY